MDDKIEDGISIGELFSIVWKRKIIVAIATIVTMLVVLLTVMLFVNPSKTVYKTTFELEFMGLNNNKYPSGKSFEYRNIVSDDSVIEVLSNEDYFNKTEIQNFNSDTLSIVEIVPKTIDETSILKEYVITVNANLFKTREDAGMFITDLINLEYERIIADFNSISYSTSIDMALNSETFELELNLLNTQKNYILTHYADLIEVFGDQTINGKKLSSYRVEADTYYSINSISNLSTKLSHSFYVKDESNLYSLELRANSLNIQINESTLKQTELIKQRDELLDKANANFFPEIDSYNNQIVELTTQLIDLNISLDNVNLKINACKEGLTVDEEVELNAFIAELKRISDKTVEFTNELTEVTQNLFADFTYAKIPSREVATSEGSISIILAALVGAVLGGGISCVAVVALDLSKLNKEEKIEEETK